MYQLRNIVPELCVRVGLIQVETYVAVSTEFHIIEVAYFYVKNTFFLVSSVFSAIPKYSYLVPSKFHLVTAFFIKRNMIYVPVEALSHPL